MGEAFYIAGEAFYVAGYAFCIAGYVFVSLPLSFGTHFINYNLVSSVRIFLQKNQNIPYKQSANFLQPDLLSGYTFTVLLNQYTMLTVLVADNSARVLERLKGMLESFNKVKIVGSATNGRDALAMLRFYKPDLAIVDLMMPGLNGFEILSKIRKTDKGLIFILQAFYSTSFYRHLALGAGADYFFTKPNDSELLATVISDCIINKFNQLNRVHEVNEVKNYSWVMEE